MKAAVHAVFHSMGLPMSGEDVIGTLEFTVSAGPMPGVDPSEFVPTVTGKIHELVFYSQRPGCSTAELPVTSRKSLRYRVSGFTDSSSRGASNGNETASCNSWRMRSRANGYSKLGKRWEGDAPAEPRGKLRLPRVFRLGGSLALP